MAPYLSLYHKLGPLWLFLSTPQQIARLPESQVPLDHQPLLEERLAHNRWRLDNYKNSHEVLNVAAESDSGNNKTSVVVSTNRIHQPQPKTQHQKYSAPQVSALRRAIVIPEAGSKEFNSKMNAKQKHLGCKKSARPISSHNGYISDQNSDIK